MTELAHAFNEHGYMYYDCVTTDGWRVDGKGAWTNDCAIVYKLLVVNYVYKLKML